VHTAASLPEPYRLTAELRAKTPASDRNSTICGMQVIGDSDNPNIRRLEELLHPGEPPR
jgi:hypothetical protein